VNCCFSAYPHGCFLGVVSNESSISDAVGYVEALQEQERRASEIIGGMSSAVYTRLARCVFGGGRGVILSGLQEPLGPGVCM
jgi:hypothetical protein